METSRARLVAALARHEPADATEARHREAIIALVAGSSACFDRTHYRPGHVTGSAFVVDAASGTVLLHRHRRLGRWLQFGGHDDHEHDPLRTALREAREESGLTDLTPLDSAILDLDVHAIEATAREPGHEHHDVRYALLTRTPTGIAPAAAESRDLAWLSLAEADARMAEAGGTRALSRLARLV